MRRKTDVEPGQGKREAWLTALAPGETTVSADIRLADGRVLNAPVLWNVAQYPVRVTRVLRRRRAATSFASL